MAAIKSVFLATSSTMLLVGGMVQAADLPSRKAAPVEYVRVCDAYGAGFYWIPGSDTCLKVGGRVRIDTWYTPARSAVQLRSAGGPAFTGAPGGGTASSTFTNGNGVDALGWYARGLVMMDARTQSAWGTVQTVISLRFGAQTGLAQTAPFVGYNITPLAMAGATTPIIEAAYIRFAGFTFGQAASNFAFLPPATYHSLWAAGFPNGIRQVSYTAAFGAGLSASIALENRGDLTTTGTANALGFNPLSPTAATATATSPQRLPALVGNLRVDQAWGSAMLSGVVLQNTANFATPAVLAVTNGVGPLVTKTGWAVGAGVRILLPMLATGDSVVGWVAYGVGSLDYTAMVGLNSNTSLASNYVGGFLRMDRNMTVYCVGAGCPAFGVEQAKVLNLAAIFTHYWTPSLRSNLQGTYIRLTPGNVTRNTDWTNGGLSAATGWSVQGNVIWSPVRNFDIGAELSYARLNQTLAGFAGGLPTPVPCSAAAPMCAASVSAGNWTGRMRVERTF
jgi:hypothetical protein